MGASWEGFAIEQVLRVFEPSQAYFWSTHGGAEVDLLFMHQGRRLGFEVKFTEAPRITASMRSASATLNLDHLWVIYPGAHEYPMEAGITALPLHRLLQVAASFN